MYEQEELLNLKVVIRSLLVADKRPIPLKSFLKEYRSQEGVELPFRKFGYQNPALFLQSIPDTVQILQRNDEIYVKPTVTEDIEHVQKLVSAQKNKSTINSSYQPIGGGGCCPTLPSRFSRLQNNTARTSSQYLLKKNMTELLGDYAEGLTIADLNVAYQERFGSRLDSKLGGYAAVEEFLETCKDKVKVTRTETGTTKVELLKKVSKESLQSSQIKVPQPPSASRNISKQKPDMRALRNKVRENLYKISERYRDGVWLAQFCSVYREISREDLCPSDIGYPDMLSLLEDNKDIFRLCRPIPNGDFLLIPEEKRPTVNPNPAPPKPREMQKDTVEQLTAVLRVYEEGLTVSELACLYKHTYKIPITPKDILATCVRLTTDIDIKHLSRSGEYFLKLKPGHMKNKERSYIPPEIKMPAEHTAGLQTVTRRKNSYPKLTLDITRMAYKVQEIPPTYNYQDFIPVYVAHINNPSLVYLHLRGKDTSVKLEELMNELEKVYYGHLSDVYKVKEPQEGLPCAALYPPWARESADWHRATITQIKDEKTVEVFYVDYGTHAVVKTSDIRCLRKEFLELPTQAIMCKLAYIGPKDGKTWNREASVRILELAKDKVMMCCFLTRVHEVYDILLCEVAGDKDVYINDVLLDGGYARIEEGSEMQEAFLRGLDLFSNNVLETLDDLSNPTSSDGSEEDPLNEASHEADGNTQNCVKQIVLKTGYIISLINFEKKPFITAEDVSALFNQRKSTIKELLDSKKISFPVKVVEKEKDQFLFKQLQRHNVRGLKKNNSSCEYVTLFPLPSVEDILRLFEHPSKPLLHEIKELLLNFDPDDQYWNPHSKEGDQEAETLQSLRLELQTLSIERSHLYSTWPSSAEGSESRLYMLRDIEAQLKKVEEKIKLREVDSPTSSVHCSKSKVQQEFTSTKVPAGLQNSYARLPNGKLPF